MPKGENVEHGVMVLALMSKRVNMVNVVRCYGVGIDIKKSQYGHHYQ
jgi:hypothetical protein